MASLSIFDTVLLYSFIKRLVTPFNKWKAYQTGVIDGEGNILIPPKKRTPVQKRSLRMYDVLVMNLKKLLGKVPGGKSRLASYAAAVMLLRENDDIDFSDEQKLWETIQSYFDEAQDILNEDAPTMSVGDASGMAGLDNNPPFYNKKKKKLVRRKEPKQ
jgi:hypothetical protein